MIGKRFMASSTFALAISLTVEASGSEKNAAAAALVFAAASFASTFCCCACCCCRHGQMVNESRKYTSKCMRTFRPGVAHACAAAAMVATKSPLTPNGVKKACKFLVRRNGTGSAYSTKPLESKFG